MKSYTKTYLNFFGYDVSDWIPCEIPECGQRCQDIHHIECRGMGGTEKKDVIENLMGLCRPHHLEYGDRKQFIEFLKTIHSEKIKSA